MKTLIAIFLATFLTIAAYGQILNDDCMGAIDYGVLDGRKHDYSANNGAHHDTCFDVSNVGAVANFPFYYTSNFCGQSPLTTVNGAYKDVWFKVRPSLYYYIYYYKNQLSNDSARITFWTDDGNGCGNFIGGKTEIIHFNSGYYTNDYMSFGGSSSLYIQISAANPNDTISFRMCMYGYSIFSSPVCSVIGSGYDSLCFLTTVSQVNPTTTSSDDGNIAVSVSEGSPPYNFNWSNGATTNHLDALTVGNYHLTITDSTGCQNDYLIKLTAPTSVFEQTQVLYVVYPNPTSTYLNINIQGQKTVYIFNATGSTCKKVFTDSEIIDVSGLSSGVYLLRIESDIVSVPISKRFVIERP